MKTNRLAATSMFTISAGLVLPLLLTGCFVAGYSSSGGGFIWPGGLGLVVMILIVVFLLRRR